MKVNLVWITPNAEKLLVSMARVSNTSNTVASSDSLIRYLIRNAHWSPFEMVSACFEIETTRDIARQILRHRSFSFQEFSQRYSITMSLPKAEVREARMQDSRNRQNSIEVDDKQLHEWWAFQQESVIKLTTDAYNEALRRGIAKEVARVVLPEGLTTSRMFMAGTIRSWLHYIDVRSTPGTQKEHREIAREINKVLTSEMPAVFTAGGEKP